MSNMVYVTLGFHINFYHSWRGDTPDEAGFGTDIRVIRQVLKILERAWACGLQARVYWDTEVFWTFQEILPKFSPDILEGIRQRVNAGLDEIIPGPYNNGANHAATEDEFRAAIAWALENPWGSGLRQLFGKVAPYYRPQEAMFTTGQEAILKEYGIQGLILYYAGIPFNTLGAFVPALSLEQRFNPLWFRTNRDGPPLLLLPCLSTADLLEHVSLENLMLDLHTRQRRGEIQSDVLIHLNADADLENWLPVHLPKLFAWFPNTGGLEEFIRVVNQYPWASFTLPSEYLAHHPPKGDVLVRQDLADGGFDGNYSWAEKCASLYTWTLLEGSRLASYRADVLANRSGLDLHSMLWEGMDSSFFQRLIGLTTTHFGMSTPIINEERQARAQDILGGAQDKAQQAQRQAALAVRQPGIADPSCLYEVELSLTPPGRNRSPVPARAAVRLPVVLPAEALSIVLEDEQGRPMPVSITEVCALPEGRRHAQLRFVASLSPGEWKRYRVHAIQQAVSPDLELKRLKNQWLEVIFSEQTGVASLLFQGEEVGGWDFLAPFITYQTGRRPQVYSPAGYDFQPLSREVWDGLERVRLKADLPIHTPEGDYNSQFTYTFTLFHTLPYLFLDVEACFAYTPPRQVIHNVMQKLRRLIDLRWIEVAPCQLKPSLTAPASHPLRIWKHNYLGITSSYQLNYGQINPRNRSLDAFNHQVTAGWVAVSNGGSGLLVGEDAQSLASMAFCPMRLRERNGIQSLWLNPFGSYYGRQLDYSHLGGSGIGAVFLTALSGALHPNGPSFNGQRLCFSLMLAPYRGDEPPPEIQADAAAHFYPPGIVYHAAPAWLGAVIPEDVRQYIAVEERRMQVAAGASLPPPTALLASPSPGGVDLVWDAPRDAPLSGYEINWRRVSETEWNRIQIQVLTRWHIGDLQDGEPVHVKIRALFEGNHSAWTSEQVCTPGPVSDVPVTNMLTSVPLWALVRMVAASLWAVLRASVHRG